MPMQTVEWLENVLRNTLVLQENIRSSMTALATKESLEDLATAEISGGWGGNIGYFPPLDATDAQRFSDGVHGVYHSNADTAEVTEKIVQLLSRLEGGANGDVADSTTRHHRGDRKALAKEREKKIAMGHKPNDHEEQKMV